MSHRANNQALINFFLLPFLFLTVALLGGLRIDAESRNFVFIAPPLITLVLALLLMLLLVRGDLIRFQHWLGSDFPPLTNVAHIWLLVTVFFASAQAFNSVLPERGLFHWMFSFFFLWTLWNNQFSSFDPRRLLRSLAILFGTAFVLKHMLLGSLYGPEGGWLKRLGGALFRGVTEGTIDAPSFAPITGYIGFFTLTLYVAGLILLSFADNSQTNSKSNIATHPVVEEYRHLPVNERLAVREAILDVRRELQEPEHQPARHDE